MPSPPAATSGLTGPTDRPGHAERLYGAARPGRHADAASRDRMHAMLLLPAAPAWSLALLVPFAELSSPAGPLAAPGARRIRFDAAARGRDQGRGLEPEMPLHGPPDAPCGTENWTEEQLVEIVTRDCMIGVALPRPDRKADDVRPVHKASRPVGGEHNEPGGGS